MQNYKKNNWVSIGGVVAQANVRVIVTSVLIAVYYFSVYVHWIEAHSSLWVGLWSAVATLYAGFCYLYSRKREEYSIGFRLGSMLVDVALLSVASYLAGPNGAALFPLYLLITLGYGLPNGEQVLQITAAASSFAFSLVYLASPEVQAPAVAIGLLGSLFYLPLALATSDYFKRQDAPGLQAEEQEGVSESEALTEISHELRQQISEVVSSSDRLLETKDLSPRKKMLTRNIIDNSATALRLVKEVDEYARLSSGQHRYQLEPSSLIHVIREVNGRVSEEAQKKHLAYEVVFHPALLGRYMLCRQEISQVLYHLIGNAIKYTQQGYVRLSINPARGGKIQWRFDVSDSGIGIEESQQMRVFEPFVRSSSGRLHETRGIGLGATIARQLVEGMGGVIGVQSQENEGSTFWFELPVEPAHGASDCTESAFCVCLVSPSRKERKVFEQLALNNLVSLHIVSNEDLSDLDFSTLEGLVFGEYVTNQQLLQVLERYSGEMRGSREIPVFRFQRMQPDDMLIYSRRKMGDMVFLPTSISEEGLVKLMRAVIRDGCEEKKVANAEQGKLNVLIADGQTVSRDILATMLVNRGHQIYMARNALQTLDIVSGIKLDLILLDPALADDNLVKAMKLIVEQRKPVRCLMLAGPNGEEQIPPGLASFVDGFLGKPLNSNSVYEAIETLMGRAPGEHDLNDFPDLTYFPGAAGDDRVKIMNTQHLHVLEKANDTPTTLHRYIEQYLEDNTRLMRVFREACNRQDADQILNTARELADLSEKLGLDRFTKTLRDVQFSDDEAMPGLISNFRERIETVNRESRHSLLDFKRSQAPRS